MLSSTLSAAERHVEGGFPLCHMPVAAEFRESANPPPSMGDFNSVLEKGMCLNKIKFTKNERDRFLVANTEADFIDECTQ